MALGGQEVKVEGVVCPGKPRGDWGSARASGHTSVRQLVPGELVLVAGGYLATAGRKGSPHPSSWEQWVG